MSSSSHRVAKGRSRCHLGPDGEAVVRGVRHHHAGREDLHARRASGGPVSREGTGALCLSRNRPFLDAIIAAAEQRGPAVSQQPVSQAQTEPRPPPTVVSTVPARSFRVSRVSERRGRAPMAAGTRQARTRRRRADLMRGPRGAIRQSSTGRQAGPEGRAQPSGPGAARDTCVGDCWSYSWQRKRGGGCSPRDEHHQHLGHTSTDAGWRLPEDWR